MRWKFAILMFALLTLISCNQTPVEKGSIITNNDTNLNIEPINATKEKIIECRVLWWFDDMNLKCQQKKFCGAFMYQSLRTFETKEECEKALKEVLNQTEIECYSDEDCIHKPSCCHRNAMQCIPRSEVNNTLKCENIYCTMECRPCTTCKCINHKCATETLEGGCC